MNAKSAEALLWEELTRKSLQAMRRPRIEILSDLTGYFVVKDHLITNREGNSSHIGAFGKNFLNWFHDTVETLAFQSNVSSIKFDYLTEVGKNVHQVINENGGVKEVPVNLAEIFSLVRKQSITDCEGPLLVDSRYDTIFFVLQKVKKGPFNTFSYLDIEGNQCESFVTNVRHLVEINGDCHVLRVVSVQSTPDGWALNAHDLNDPMCCPSSKQVGVRDEALRFIGEVQQEILGVVAA